MDCGKLSSRKESEKAGAIKAMTLCFQELTDRKFRWVHIKDLYRCTKTKINKLYNFPIKWFHELLLELYETSSFEERKVDFSRGNSARPYTSRYGIHTPKGIYAYVKFRRKKSETNNS